MDTNKVDSEAAKTPPPSENRRWERILCFLQETGMVIDYLHWRVDSKRHGEQPASSLFLMEADTDGELTEDMVIEQLEAIARQARAGFVDGPDFPVFGSLAGRLKNSRQGGKE